MSTSNQTQTSPEDNPDRPRKFRLNEHYRVYRDGSIESRLKQGRPRSDGTPHLGPWHSVKQYLRGRGDDRALKFQVRLKTAPGKSEYDYYPVAHAVLMMWGPPRPTEDAKVIYRDGDIENCHIDNLMWVERIDLPKVREQLDLDKWAKLYEQVVLCQKEAEQVAKEQGMSLVSAVNKLRLGKREYERRCRSAAQSSSSD